MHAQKVFAAALAAQCNTTAHANTLETHTPAAHHVKLLGICLKLEALRQAAIVALSPVLVAARRRQASEGGPGRELLWHAVLLDAPAFPIGASVCWSYRERDAKKRANGGERQVADASRGTPVPRGPHTDGGLLHAEAALLWLRHQNLLALPFAAPQLLLAAGLLLRCRRGSAGRCFGRCRCRCRLLASANPTPLPALDGLCGPALPLRPPLFCFWLCRGCLAAACCPASGLAAVPWRHSLRQQQYPRSRLPLS